MNRRDQISLDEATKFLTSDEIIITQGEEEYKKGIKILYKMLGVTTRGKKDEKGKDPFELLKKSVKGLLR